MTIQLIVVLLSYSKRLHATLGPWSKLLLKNHSTSPLSVAVSSSEVSGNLQIGLSLRTSDTNQPCPDGEIHSQKPSLDISVVTQDRDGTL